MDISDLAGIEMRCLFDFIENLNAEYEADWACAISIYGGKNLMQYYLNTTVGFDGAYLSQEQDFTLLRQDIHKVYAGLAKIISMIICYQRIEAALLEVELGHGQAYELFNAILKLIINASERASQQITDVSIYEIEFWKEDYSKKISSYLDELLWLAELIYDNQDYLCDQIEGIDIASKKITHLFQKQASLFSDMLFSLYREKKQCGGFSPIFRQTKENYIDRLGEECSQSLVLIDDFKKSQPLRLLGAGIKSIFHQIITDEHYAKVTNYFNALSKLPYLQNRVNAVATLDMFKRGRFTIFADSNRWPCLQQGSATDKLSLKS